MVETDREGYEANKLHGKLGIRASDTAEVSFSNVRVPVANLVGTEGNGFKELMAFFDLTRIIVAAQGVGEIYEGTKEIEKVIVARGLLH